MKTLKLIAFMLLVAVTATAQDVVYATALNAGKIKKITANATTGATTGNFTDVETIEPSAALGINSSGWLYFLKYGSSGTGEGDGKVDVYATKADGTGSPVRIANNADLNGSSNNDLGFVRLGVDVTGVAWIIASDNSNKLYLAKFTTNGSNSVTVTTVTNNITTSDGDNSLFKNGDLAFDGLGNMYALANNDNTGSTKIYTLNPNSVPLNGAGVLQYKWTLKEQDGDNFSGRVNGAAFTSTGSMFLSTDNGLYFIDQNSTGFSGIGTVKCSLVKAQSDLTDLATAYWPQQTRLPIRFKTFTTRKVNENVIEFEFKVEEAQSVKQFNVRASRDGKTFTTIAIVLPDSLKPENTYRVKVDLSKVKF